MIINVFKDKKFPLNNLSDYPQYNSEEDISPRMSFNKDESPKSNSPNETSYDELNKSIAEAEKELDSSVIKEYFYNDSLKKLFEYLRFSKNTIDSSKVKHVLIMSRLEYLKNDIKKCLMMK